MLKCILVRKYNTPVHIFFLQASFTLPLSVLKSFLGGKEQHAEWGVPPSKLLHGTLALSTTLTSFGKKFPLTIGYSIVIKKLLIACHQICPVQEEGSFWG